MHIVGANCHSSKPNLRETGIIEEILLENKRRNPYADFPIFDMIIWEKVKMEENITAFLNTNIEDIVTEDGRIRAVIGHQNTTETRWTVCGTIFVDATGHGTVGVLAGAESRVGSESKYEFNEPTAPEQANSNKMGNTIMVRRDGPRRTGDVYQAGLGQHLYGRGPKIPSPRGSCLRPGGRRRPCDR